MKIITVTLFCLSFHFSFSQKLDVGSLEKILNYSFSSADSLLKTLKFGLTEKETGKSYYNYYYTSYEYPNTPRQIIRSLSLMDVYNDSDTSRLILYRTYSKNDQEELVRQMLAGGYEISKRVGNNFTYKKDDLVITNKITEKNIPGSKPVTAYEFELGR